MIFSLLAKSRARSNGILRLLIQIDLRGLEMRVPYAFEMHGANLDDMPHFLTLENSVPSASGHAGNIEEFGTVYHVVI